MFGIVADFGGQYRTASNLGSGFPGVVAKTSVYQYLAGPSFTARREQFEGFAHGLVGGARGQSGISGFSDSGLTLGGGGGVDVRVGDRTAVRAQIDYLGSFVDILEDNIRVGLGIAIRFGLALKGAIADERGAEQCAEIPDEDLGPRRVGSSRGKTAPPA